MASPASVDAFRALDEDSQRQALARMSPEAKQSLLTSIKAPGNVAPPPSMREPAAGTISPAPEVGSKQWFKEKAASALQYAPLVGGIAGGVIGAPGVGTAALGAAAGGVLGETLRQQGREALGFPATPGETPTAAGTAQDIAAQGATQGAAELGGQALSGAAKYAATNPAVQRWMARPLNRMLRPGVEAFDYGANPGVALMKQGPPIFTGKYGMRDFISQRISDLGNARDAVAGQLARRGVTLDAQTPIQNVVTKAIANPTKYEEDTLVNTLADIEERLTTERGQGMIAGPGGKLIPVRIPRGYDKMPVDEAIKFRQYLDDAIGEFDPDTKSRVKGAFQSMRGAVNEAIHNAAPQLREADSQLQGLEAARPAIQRRIAHLESGTRETSAGQGMLGNLATKLHVPGTHTIPGSVALSRARGLLGLPGRTEVGRQAIRQIPRIPLIPSSEEESNQQ